MKTQKFRLAKYRFIYFMLFITTLVVFFSSCRKSDLEEIATKLTLSETSIKVDTASGISIVQVNCNGPWRAKLLDPAVEWITFDQHAGKGNGTFYINYASNYKGVPRIADIVVNAGHTSDTIRFEQAGDNPFINLAANEYLDEEGLGGNIEVDIETNLPDGMVNKHISYNGENVVEWISDVSIADGKLKFTLAPNVKDEVQRSGGISLSYIDPYDNVVSAILSIQQNPGAIHSWYVKQNGTGRGTSWDDALSASDFVQGIQDKFADGDVIYLAGGTYYVGNKKTDLLEITKELTIVGGFNPNITGNATELVYPSMHETIISGDVNKNGIIDTEDAQLVNIKTTNKVIFKGITFSGSYTRVGPISTSSNSDLEFWHCTISDNEAYEAAGALYAYTSKIYAYKTIITNNKSKDRGGAIRIDAGSKVVLEACLVSNNSLTGKFGGAIQMTGGANLSELYVINTTITGNSCFSGGAGISVSANQKLYLISSTLSNNVAQTDPDQGHNLRIESNNVFLINSIISGPSDKTPDLYTSSNVTVQSQGYNVIGSVTGNFVSASTDMLNKSYSDVFGSNVLSANGGYPNSIALQNNFSGIGINDLESKVGAWNATANFKVDQRGKARPSTNASAGAYEKNPTN